MVLIGIGSFICIVVISVFWVKGIDYMNNNHPDYKGNDLFMFDEDDHIL